MSLFPNPPTFALPSVKDSNGQEVFNPLWLNWFVQLAQTIDSLNGLSITITTAKLTSGGSNGSMTFTNGLLTGQTAAT